MNWRMRAVVLVLAAAVAASATRAAASDPSDPAYTGSGSGVFEFGEHASYLGIDPRDVTADRLGPLKLKDERGVEVMMVDQDAPAGKAGVKEHDVILSFNGAPVESVAELTRMLHETPPGRSVALGLSRDGQPLTVQVTLADRAEAVKSKYKGDTIEMPEIHIPPIDLPTIEVYSYGASRYGLQVERLTTQLGDYFGVKNGAGALVRSVEKGSAADSAGFKAGDVIVKVEKDAVSSPSDWTLALRRHRGETVHVSVVRDHREQAISLAIPTRSSGTFWMFDNGDMQSFTRDLQKEHLDQLKQKLDSKKLEEITSKAMAEAQRALKQYSVEIKQYVDDER